MTEPSSFSAVNSGSPGHRAGASALARRIVAFAGLPLLSLLAPFIFLPVLARLADNESWVAIALGQSVGAFVALVSSLGYATLMPPTVAVSDAHQRRRILATSLHLRVPVWLIAAPIGVVAAILINGGGGDGDAAMMAIAMGLAGLAPTWYWIGVGKVKPILWLEVVPRLVASLAATGILLWGGSVVWYPVLLAAAMLVAPVGVAWKYTGREVFRIDHNEVRGVMRKHPPAVIAETAAGTYNALAVALVTAAAPAVQAAQYISGDKTYRIGQYGVSALGNALQGWTVQAAPGRLGTRMRVTIALHLALGTVGLLASGLLGPWATRVLFQDEIAITHGAAWGFGVAMLGISLGTACGRIGLISLGARKTFMACVVASAAVGVVLLVVGAATWGAVGAAWAVGITELASGTAQGVMLAYVWRKRGAVLATDQPVA